MRKTKTKVNSYQVKGDLNIYTVASVKEELMPIVNTSMITEIDLSSVQEMDSAGLQLLVLAKRESLAKNAELRLVGHTPAVLDVLDICDMAGYFGDPVVISSK